MKLSAAIDLPALQREALARVDEIFAAKAPVSRLDAVYAAKAVEAQRVMSGGAPHAALAADAASRGISVGALCLLITTKANAARERLLDHESDRLAAKAAVAAANDQHALRRAMSTIEGTS